MPNREEHRAALQTKLSDSAYVETVKTAVAHLDAVRSNTRDITTEDDRLTWVGNLESAQNALIKALKLPTLTGSEKQVAWADDIRKKAITGFDLIQNISVGYIDFVVQDLVAHTFITDAAWWISNRNGSPRMGDYLLTDDED